MCSSDLLSFVRRERLGPGAYVVGAIHIIDFEIDDVVIDDGEKDIAGIQADTAKHGLGDDIIDVAKLI